MLMMFRKEMKRLMDKCVGPTVELILAQIESVEASRGTGVKVRLKRLLITLLY